MKRWMCVVDIEATCWADRKLPGPDGQGWVEPRNEIIELGAAMVGLPDLSAGSEFDMFVRPSVNPVLTDFCKTLTSIRQQDVDEAQMYPAALERFNSWISTFGPKEDVLFSSWGMYDKTQILRDCELGMEFEGTPHRGIDDVRNIIRIVRKVGLDLEGLPASPA